MANGAPEAREYDLRRFPSKYNGKCAGCGTFYNKGELVLWGKPGGKSSTFHNREGCVPRSLSVPPGDEQQVPRSHSETPATAPAAEPGGAFEGGHAEIDPKADTFAGSRMVLAKLDALEHRTGSILEALTQLRRQVGDVVKHIENAPF